MKELIKRIITGRFPIDSERTLQIMKAQQELESIKMDMFWESLLISEPVDNSPQPTKK